MSTNHDSKKIVLQAKIFDFALTDLVIRHRNSFEPFWTLDSWAKFLIWMTLNCGLSGEGESLELFADALGPSLSKRMRRIFFERTLENLSIRLMADPAESKVLVMSLRGASQITEDQAALALDRVGLVQRVELDRSSWEVFDAMISIPWKSSSIGS